MITKTMQNRIHNNKKIRFRGNGYGKTASISFSYHELDLMEIWDKLADQSFLSKSGVFKKFLRSEGRKLKDTRLSEKLVNKTLILGK